MVSVADIHAILSSDEVAEGKIILILMRQAVALRYQVSDLMVALAGGDKITMHEIFDQMQVDAGNMEAAARAMATAPTSPVM